MCIQKSDVDPFWCTRTQNEIIIKANAHIRYAYWAGYGRGGWEAVACMGIIITGKYPSMQNNIELKKFEVAKLFVIRENESGQQKTVLAS